MLKNRLKYSVLFCLLGAGMTSLQAQDQKKKDPTEEHNPVKQVIPEAAKNLLGRWDLNVNKQGKVVPSWLEIKLSGFTTLVGYYVGDSGSARPVSHVKLENGKFSFSIPPQWEGGEGDFVIQGELTANGMKGTVKTNKGTSFDFTGEKAPYLKRTSTVKWGKPIELFNGKDLTGWKATSANNQWVVKDGILINQKAGANLITDQKFDDFKLEAEFRYTTDANSGIYLRGRYELQIEDSPKDRHPGNLYFGGIYGFLSPNEMATLGTNEWQKYEVTLVGRLVTVVANGKTIISNQEIPGITGGALDSKEGESGPIYLQGDHAAVEFRKIKITPAKK
ncbi:DUF1080 domain-containing protein [Sphingobacterium sp. SRCM116780]|uniref:3-keto-disaccharide hydrolase n=1 Tax=Sphingobacterium sp. SRCM116780 TaxID=2907623 RepID=UPI001F2ED15A|nr:DUF1080 domain-containing protein [Sphingobacterium sp. SRCM116780]UIR54727.1 DUF1080 domain-containing protein [Sphingobacterium sp. SRCM116780]